VMFRTGRYLEKARFPSQLGFEASGTVLATGPGVESIREGYAVCVLPGFDMSAYGTYGDHAIIPHTHMLPKPKALTQTEAAGFWMPYLTAYGGLVEAGRLSADDYVLISAASSSVGLAAIQIARQIGAPPIATTLNSIKRDELIKAGAHAVIATE